MSTRPRAARRRTPRAGARTPRRTVPGARSRSRAASGSPRTPRARTAAARSESSRAGGDSLVAAAPRDHRLEALLERDARAEAQQVLGLLGAADALGDERLLLRPVLRLEVGARQLQQQLDELADRRPHAHADVEELVGRVALQRADVRPSDVRD